ncbi:sigma-70 family RNA polymerase sigma factor [Hyphomonas sp.]|uniref:RNA polymerase sigma factor n=1 Tax=Hyphomonas sp. TaxID=87 RepID=UPI0025C63FB6|nr:sigma-70 family RNA polymerase sigma factor [Hyphomonas sp.]MBI1400106.1 sigma-70 family RNA polymerase sigma factor [Hyphomonas sp.]
MSSVSGPDELYLQTARAFGPALQRLAQATEANVERRRDLLQDMHVALWRSFATFDGRCSLKTWVYRVAHNTAASHVDRERRRSSGAVSLDAAGDVPAPQSLAAELEQSDALARVMAWIRRLKSPDRQVMTLYLEELDAAAIAEITGLTPGAVATRISRLKAQLTKDFQGGRP